MSIIANLSDEIVLLKSRSYASNPLSALQWDPYSHSVVPVTILRQTAAWKDPSSGYTAKTIRHAVAPDSRPTPHDSGTVRRNTQSVSGFPKPSGTRNQRAFLRNPGENWQVFENAGCRTFYFRFSFNSYDPPAHAGITLNTTKPLLSPKILSGFAVGGNGCGVVSCEGAGPFAVGLPETPW
jgi:hypothetical protein